MVVEQLISQIKVQGADNYVAQMRKVAATSAMTGASVSGIGKAFSTVSLAMGKLAGIGAVGALGIGALALNAAADYEQLRNSLVAVTGSAEEAERQFNRLRQVARLPGLEIEGLVKGVTGFQAVGLSAMGAERLMRGLANETLKAGGNQDVLNRLQMAFSQVLGKNEVMAEELNQQLFEAAPALRAIMKAQFGASTAEELRNMGISAQQFTSGMIEGMEKARQVGGGMRNEMVNALAELKRVMADLGDTLKVGVLPILRMISAALGGIGVTGVGAVEKLNIAFEAVVGTVLRLAQVLSLIIGSIGAVMIATGNMAKGLLLMATAGVLAIGAYKGLQWLDSTRKGRLDLMRSGGPAGPDAPGVDTSLPVFTDNLPSVNSNTGVQQAAWLKYLAQIAENTKPIVDWTRQAFGGGDLGRLGVTPTELRGFRGGAMAGGNNITVIVQGSTQEAVTDAILSLKRRGVI